uniref:Uncharacterized protein n=1 Tax=Pristionchus pacificus TaxID=54126 RepID=A0A2A6CGJ7_PRIPA|eukprot:PDM77345.1 hypothetical protein PRIPAC_33075 [Pristionchus pacificus]
MAFSAFVFEKNELIIGRGLGDDLRDNRSKITKDHQTLFGNGSLRITSRSKTGWEERRERGGASHSSPFPET